MDQHTFSPEHQRTDLETYIGQLQHRLRLYVHVAAADLVLDLVHQRCNVAGLILAAVGAEPLDERAERTLEHPRGYPAKRAFHTLLAAFAIPVLMAKSGPQIVMQKLGEGW